MKRDEYLALEILQTVQAGADKVGISLSRLIAELPGRHNEWTDEMTYQLWLLTNGGYLSKSFATETEPASVQLTWSGHDLLEKLSDN